MFRTEINLPSSPFQLGLSSKVATIGSCFSDVMGQKLQHYKVKTLVNPFGTIFNPISLCHLLEMACSQNYDLEEHLVQHNDIWYHYGFHSSFSSPDQQALLDKMKEALDQTQAFLRSAQLLVLTFGTAVAYELKDEGTVVANCHKLPDQNFERRLLSYYEMMDAFGAMCAHLKMLNPGLKILLTVSPVRHLKETIQLNSVSKAHLRIACHHFAENFPDVSYFPAYELMIDDLRDYRFYKDDMIHPSSLAENYIWRKFTESYFEEEFHAFLTEWDQIQKSLSHTPFHPESRGHQHFLRNLLGSLHRMAQKVDVREEIEKVRQQLGPEPIPEKKSPERRLSPAPQDRPEQEEEAELTETAQAPEMAEAHQPKHEPVPARDKNQPRLDKSRKNKKSRGKKVVLEPVDRKKQLEPAAASTQAAASPPVAVDKRAERPIKVVKHKARPESVSATPTAEAPPRPTVPSPAEVVVQVEQPPQQQPQPPSAVPEPTANQPVPAEAPAVAKPKKRPPRKKPAPKPAPPDQQPASEASPSPEPPKKPRKPPVKRGKAGQPSSPTPEASDQ